METNAAGQNVAQAVEDGFHRRLLDQRGGHIEQGSIPAMGGRQPPLSSGMRIRLAPQELIFHIETLSHSRCLEGRPMVSL